MSFRRTLPLLTQQSKSKSSTQWIARQRRDPYMKKRIAVQDPARASALVTSYRARSAFKLLEINEQMGSFLDREDVKSVVDLGAAPGGWSQVVAAKLGWWGATDMVLEAVEQSFESYDSLASETEVDLKKRRPKKVKKGKARLRTSIEEEMDHYDPLNIDHLTLSSQRGRGVIIAVDLLPILPIPGVETLQADFLQDSTTELIQKLLTSKDNPHGKADVILSDVAANVSGNRTHDVQSSLEICEAVFQFAKWNLRSAESIGRKKGGVLLVKFFTHPLLDQFRVEKLEPNFHYVHYIKPDSSRAASREGYFLCQGWNP